MVGHEKNNKSNKKNKNIKSWKSISVSGPILDAIKELGFIHPTEIQSLTIPAAIEEQRDIIGAAETGSGKTLAFAIPIITGIMKDERKEKREKSSIHDDVIDLDDVIANSENKEMFEDNIESEEENDEMNELGCVNVIDNIDDDVFSGLISKKSVGTCKPLHALIVTPTRELAVQIKKHIDSILKKTKIKSEVVIGGLSTDKQERLLNKGPQIVIGTPGRLYQLISDGNAHLSQLSSIRYLAIDETDRMLEAGHFEELRSLLEIINRNSAAKSKRQTFVFSATLSLVHDVPKRLHTKKKKAVKLSSEQKINQLMQIIGVRENAKIVDITPTQATTLKLTESKIFCSKEEKELYLHYFIQTYPGRTLIFCNSVNCVRRLQNVFELLQCNPKTIHSSKNQKQRLSTLEKFTSKKNCILFATDVAARGLDIPHVQYIVHYEVPKTAESYVHRSGRTARATEEGLSILLVEPAEVSRCEKIYKTLNKTTEMTSFPINHFRLGSMRETVNLAKQIETSEHKIKNSDCNESWERKMAKAADLEWDSENDDDEDRAREQRGKKRKRNDIQAKRYQLKSLLGPQTLSAKRERYYHH